MSDKKKYHIVPADWLEVQLQFKDLKNFQMVQDNFPAIEVPQWECFCDESYYHMWAVRPVGDRSFSSKKLFHVASKEDAESLCEFLNLIFNK